MAVLDRYDAAALALIVGMYGLVWCSWWAVPFGLLWLFAGAVIGAEYGKIWRG